MTPELGRDLAIKAFDAINQRDAASLEAVFAPKWAADFEALLPKVYALWEGHRIEATDMVAEGESVWCRVRTSGTHTGEWMGIPPTGRKWTNTGVWFFRIAGNKINEVEWLMDGLNMIHNLGATVTPNSSVSAKQRVFGYVHFELLPSVSPAEFEAFMKQELARGIDRPGMTFHVVRADRGKRKGRYALLVEFDSIAARDRLFPVEGGGTSDEVLAERLEVLLGGMGKLTGTLRFTDYVDVT